MSKKFNNRTLLLILIVLAGIFILSKTIFSGRNERNFRTRLLEMDTAKVSEIQLFPKQGEAFKLIKLENSWKIQQGDAAYKADQNAVKNLLGTLLGMKPQRLAATSEEKWKAMEVTDSLATRVKVLEGSKETADLYIGKLNFSATRQQPMPGQQAMPNASTFVRVGNEDNVYVVDGFQTMAINTDFDSWRDRTFLKVNQADITQLAFMYPADSSFTLTKTNGQWMLDGTPADSAQMQNYLRTVANLSNGNFADSFSELGKNAPFQLVVEGNNMEAATIKAFPQDSTFVLSSSQTPEVYFSSDSTGLFSQVFSGKNELLPKPETENQGTE